MYPGLVEDQSVGEGVQRVSVAGACELLGISEGAARKRIARGTLKTERDPTGRVWVLLPDREPGGQDKSGTRAGRQEATRAPWWRRWFG